MSDRAISWIVIILIFLVVGAGVGGFLYGKHQGFANGYSSGKDVGYKQGKEDAPEVTTYIGEYMNLQEQYNQLVNDYNRLVGAASAAARKPLTCSSSTYGMNSQFTSTNCY